VKVWATPAPARIMGRALEQQPKFKSGRVLYAIIESREWTAEARLNPGVSDLDGSFRRLIEVAEGCGLSCDFSQSNVK
jgi:hypothetical protein